MKKVVMDTNFVMEVVKSKIDLKKELDRVLDFPYRLFIVEGTINELKNIANEQKGRERKFAKLALGMVKDISSLEAEGNYVDEKLLKISGKDTIIATQDKGLKRKIKGNLITVRQRRYLTLI